MKKKIFYEVMGQGVTWSRKEKRWMRFDDPLYGKSPHRGYDSHRPCKTLRAVLRHCRQLDALVDQGREIFALKYTKTKSRRRRIEELRYRRGT